MDQVSLDTFLALIFRHAVTVASGYLIASGYVPGTVTKEQLIGAGMGAGAIALSWWNKRGYSLAMERLKAFETKFGIQGIAAHYVPAKTAEEQFQAQVAAKAAQAQK